ncbi:hypothetical protein Tco_0321878 [Tanacetum coccineum]
MLKQKQAGLGMATIAMVQDQGQPKAALRNASYTEDSWKSNLWTSKADGVIGLHLMKIDELISTLLDCPRGEIKKIETEMWNLKVKGTDVVAYSRRFQQLALMCSRMFPEEIDKVEKYIGGLPDMILGSVKASKSKTMQEVIEFTTELR